MRIDPATPEDISNVASRMRESDYTEFSALYPSETRFQLVQQMVDRYGYRDDIYAAKIGDKPVAIGGAIQVRPNVLTLLFFATGEFKEIAVPFTRFMKQRFFPPMIEAGVHRIECVSIVGHEEAHKWIRALGLEQEGEPIKGFGKNGEAFISFAWVAEHVR